MPGLCPGIVVYLVSAVHAGARAGQPAERRQAQGQRAGKGDTGEGVSGYDVILADPPWHFQNWNGAPGELTPGQQRRGNAQSHYRTMSQAEIESLPIPTAKDSVLLLWSCWPLLPEAMRTIDAWGFTYKTLAWVWVKLNPSSIGFHPLTGA